MDSGTAVSLPQLPHRPERTRGETIRSGNDNSKPLSPKKPRSRSSRQHQKVRFTDMEPEPSPLLSHARDSMYMRAELQRELDFGIPAQEEAHRYARWCAEEARREAAEAHSSKTASQNYARADTVVHPKRLSVDLSSMNIDFSNLGEDVSGLDVFSRVEVALSKQQEEKRKQKEKDKKEKKDSRLRATLMAASKWDSNFSSLDEHAGQSEKKGSHFLRKVITDKVIKYRDGNLSHKPMIEPKESTKLSPMPSPPTGESLPRVAIGGAAKHPTPTHGISLPRGISLPSSTSSGSRRPSHPEPHTQQKNSNGRPPSKSEPPPLVHPQPKLPPSVNPVAAKSPPAPPKAATEHRTMPPPSSIRVIPRTTIAPTTKPGIHYNINDNSSTNPNQSLPNSRSYEGEIHRPDRTSQNSHSAGKPPSPPRPMSNGSAIHVSHAPVTHTSPATSQQPPPPPPPPPKKPSPLPVLAADDLFSRVEQDIARSHPPLPQKDKAGDEKHRGMKLIGKALHIMHGGEKVRERVEKEKIGK